MKINQYTSTLFFAFLLVLSGTAFHCDPALSQDPPQLPAEAAPTSEADEDEKAEARTSLDPAPIQAPQSPTPPELVPAPAPQLSGDMTAEDYKRKWNMREQAPPRRTLVAPVQRTSSDFSPAPETNYDSTPLRSGAKYGSIGGLVGYGRGTWQGAVVLSGDHFEQTSGGYLNIGKGEYHVANGGIQFGNGFGLSFHNTSGIALMGVHQGGWPISLLLGLEPVNLDMRLNTNADPRDYFEWHPRGTAGLQMAIGDCKWIVSASVGGTVGTLGEDAGGYETGLGTYFNCPNFNAVGEIKRMEVGNSVDMANASVHVPMPFTDLDWHLGAHGSIINEHDGKSELFALPEPKTDQVDKRVIFSIGGSVPLL